MTPEAPKLSSLSDFDSIQEARYSAGGKGADGDPPYARDMSLTRGRILTSMERKEDGSLQYRREGD